MPDNVKKPGQPDKKDHSQDKIEELGQKPISDRDAQAVKGGVAGNKFEKK